MPLPPLLADVNVAVQVVAFEAMCIRIALLAEDNLEVLSLTPDLAESAARIRARS